jgi:hypothetical protein
MKKLRVDNGLVREPSRTLQPDDGESPTEVLPELEAGRGVDSRLPSSMTMRRMMRYRHNDKDQVEHLLGKESLRRFFAYR